MNILKQLWRDKRGNALIMAAACLPWAVGAAGLASDTIQWALWKRQLQGAADSAAIAAVLAKIAARDVPTEVNYEIDKNNNFVRFGQAATGKKYALLNEPTIGYPGNGTDWDNAVSVRLQMRKSLGFSSLFLPVPTITATATAAGVETGEYCIQALNDTGETGITVGGSAVVNVKCGMISNSTSMDAAVAFGTSSVGADPVAAVGGLNRSGNWAAGTTLLPFTLAQPDPFADIAAPVIPNGCSNFNDTPQTVQTYPTAISSSPVCMRNFTVQGNVTLRPGTYIITGDMRVNSGAKVSCAGCTFVMTNSSPLNTGTVTISAGAQISVSAAETGPYKGIMFYSDRGANVGSLSKINFNSFSDFTGAFYFPHQQVEFNGSSGVTVQCLRLIGWKLSFTGDASIKNNCPADWYGDRFKGRHVRLVA